MSERTDVRCYSFEKVARFCVAAFLRSAWRGICRPNVTERVFGGLSYELAEGAVQLRIRARYRTTAEPELAWSLNVTVPLTLVTTVYGRQTTSLFWSDFSIT